MTFNVPLLEKINNETNDKNLKCYFLIIPQLFDLKMKSRNNYEKFFYKLKKNLNIIDTTEKILGDEISSEKHDDILKKAAKEL